MKLRIGGVVIGLLLFVLSMAAQTARSGSASSQQVPPLIPFSSVATDQGGNSLSGAASITFSLYAGQSGGTPLWTERQNNVQFDATGHYSVQLGITKPNGVPTTLFTTGEARWLGVRIAEQAEQPRVLLLSVPYALKAGDAATIGGLPPSAFVLAAPLSGASAPGAEPGTGQGGPPPSGDVTGTGTVNYLPLWDSTSDITSSVVFQKGTGSTAKVGINTATPATTLDVKGAGTIRGTLSLPATGAATATAGKNSQPLNLAASAFNSNSSTAVNQTFQWQSEPVGNDTSTPSGTLNLLFGEGTTKPSETGLNIASNGQITFATGQTFPGTGNGTITGVNTAAGSGLTGGGTSGTLNLGLLTSCNAKQVLQWAGSSWACASVGAGTVTSVATGLGLKGGPITTSGTLTIDTTVIPQLGAANTFNANQTVFGTFTANAGGTAILGTSTSSTSPAIQGEGNGTGVLGVADSSSGTTVGVLGQVQSPSGYGVEGLSPGIAIIGQSSATSGGAGVDGTITSPTGYGVYGSNSAASGNAAGVYGTTNSPVGYGVEGASPGTGVYGKGLFGVAGFTSSTNGAAVVGNATATTGSATGVYGSTASPTGVAVWGEDSANGGVAGLFQVFNNSATILLGNNNGTTEFNVDAVGDVTAAGAVSGSAFQIGGQLFAYGSNANANTFLGFGGSLKTNSTVQLDTAVGQNALFQDTGGVNTAVGAEALGDNTTGVGNIGIGFDAGNTFDGTNLTGNGDIALGYEASFSTGTLNNATAIGRNAFVSESNALVLGSGANVGIGTSAPTAALDVVGNNLQALIGDAGCGSGFAGIGFVNKGGFNNCTNYALLGDTPGNVYINSSLSGAILFRNNNGNNTGANLMTIDTSGNVNIHGNLSKGGGSFKIDDPLDPANKYLYHSFVESPDMMNVYNGNITTNKAGLATVVLPNYFEALNRDFRYQLTVIGQFAQAIVAKEVSKGRFTIKTNRPGVKVSWQVTGIRQDAYANAHRIPTEVEKPPQEQGHYLHPELFGAGPEQAVGYDGSQYPAAVRGELTPTGGSRP